MNWLAHVFLSQDNIDFQLANFLADPLKGKAWEGASNDFKMGLETHKLIDSYTDSHKIVKDSKKLLKEKGLLKAVVLDITYDYLLTKNWDKYSNISLEEYSKNFYINATKRLSTIPLNAQSHVSNMIDRDLLNRYHTLDGLKISLQRLDLRLSDKLLARDTASSYYEILDERMDELDNLFLDFFPDLCSEVKKKVNNENIKHIK